MDDRGTLQYGSVWDCREWLSGIFGTLIETTRFFSQAGLCPDTSSENSVPGPKNPCPFPIPYDFAL
jgi:hypothetical protein